MTSPQSSGVNLGSAYGSITINDNIDEAIGRATRQFDNALSAIGGRMQALGSQMSAIGRQLTVVTAPLAAFGAAGIRTAATYEDALKEIQVRAGLTADELATVVDKTKEIGLESQYGPAQAADAFLQLLTSGSSVAEAMEQIDAVIAGAAASGSDLGVTADALTDVMAAFGLEASQSADVMQTLINATSSSSATFPDLIAGFANVGPAARNAGLSVEETAAALAVFAENGIKGAEGGTQLKTVLTQLQSPRARAELERLGVSLTDMQGNIRPLNDIIVDLNGALDGMSESERNQIIQELVGSYGQLGLSALLASGGIDTMVDSMAGQADIGDVAAARMDTFSGQIAFLRGSIELLMIDALMPLMNDALRPMIEWVASLVGQLREWIVANPELANRIVQILAVMTALGPILLVVGRAVGFIGGAISGLGLLLGALLSPLGLAIGLVVALGAAYINNFMGIRDFIDNEVAPRLRAFFDWLGNVWETTIKPGLVAMYEWFITSGLPGILDFVENTVWPILRDFVAFLGDIWNAVSPALGDLFNWFVDNIPTIVSTISDFLSGTWDVFKNALSGVWDFVQAGILAFSNGVTEAIERIIGWINDAKQAWEDFTSSIRNARASAENDIRAMQDAIEQGGVGGAFQQGWQNIQTFGSTVSGAWQNRDSGGMGRAGVPYLIGAGAQPELFIPQTNGTFMPNADQMMGSGMSFDGAVFQIHANTFEGGQAAARGFKEELGELMRSN